MSFAFGPRRGLYADIGEELPRRREPLTPDELAHFETLDLLYRSLCALLYNYVPMSGHPGGSISSGRFVAGILFDAMDYDLERPGPRRTPTSSRYAAGHKAMGLYAMWALRDEIAARRRAGPAARRPEAAAAPRGPARLPPQPDHRDAALHALRRQGARRAPDAGHARSSGSSTGASGVGVASSIGLGLRGPRLLRRPTRRASTSSRARAA